MKNLQLIKKTKLENSLNTLVLIGKMHAYHRKVIKGVLEQPHNSR